MKIEENSSILKNFLCYLWFFTRVILAQKQEIVRVTQQLQDAIACKDFETYS